MTRIKRLRALALRIAMPFAATPAPHLTAEKSGGKPLHSQKSSLLKVNPA